ncbi:hypothetical protein GOBAR_AA34475 [Gossypium barbadense]|uniref:Uncharacterized protein n=1 Tax=Gossypium barbadense TaxID=3634 RepID=A0A2P5W571_GOSBA|nr:hypothetical protein GOBAR_AA34475 [Gossypium barbadense]
MAKKKEGSNTWSLEILAGEEGSNKGSLEILTGEERGSTMSFSSSPKLMILRIFSKYYSLYFIHYHFFNILLTMAKKKEGSNTWSLEILAGEEGSNKGSLEILTGEERGSTMSFSSKYFMRFYEISSKYF